MEALSAELARRDAKAEKDPALSEVRRATSLCFKRLFSVAGRDPFSAVQWSRRQALISNEKGESVFVQDDVEVPASWSQMATNVVASKYFRGPLNTPERESSVRQLIGRVVETITAWGRKDAYFNSDEQAEIFRDELSTMLLQQYAAFNSPVWFNVGVEPQPQCSACFILSVDDTMESLLELQRAEAMLFKYGSGAGSNLSRIRSSKELLSGGGAASGPVSFMRGYDAWAGTIKSGGKTRRAAKMQILNCDHPDIHQFVNAKRLEEEKAWALIEQHYDGGFNVAGGAYDSVFFQNSNLSVRVTDEFMEAASEGRKFALRRRTDGKIEEEIDASKLLDEIAQGTWACGDPGLQFDTTINKWHTVPNSGRINASNPCSEYMHLDDSACNLASINLLKFLNEDGSFDQDGLLQAVDILITAQDIIVDNASYPTAKIAENAHNYRQLGLGYANLGALLMCLGLPYDSDQGREWAATVMALVCGEAYRMSAHIASVLSPFSGYLRNSHEMLRVIETHADQAKRLQAQLATETLVESARQVWEEALALGRERGFRNSQATVLAPTGTIAFLMDCDTTGIEPDIALVKYKKLVGGGMLKMVNQSVPRALRRLGYDQEQIEEIVRHIDKHDTIEGAPALKSEHLAVFDCAFRPQNGTRSIDYMGHVKMMAATQPFVSGAISKTVNLPESATVEDIRRTYLEAWKLGLKAIAIYRDNSKRSQPLATKKTEEKKELKPESDVIISRRRLPDERQAITHKFNIAGHEGYITVGLYEDGSPGEIFLVMAKEGSTLSGVMDAFATSISMALQYGVPLSALIKKFTHMRFEPSGFTSNRQIPFAKSILDYIFKWLGTKFLSTDDQRMLGILDVKEAASEPEMLQSTEQKSAEISRPVSLAKAHAEGPIGFQLQQATQSLGAQTSAQQESLSSELHGLIQLSDDAPPCALCGSAMMVRQGACYRCLNCGSQGGCG